MLSDELKGVSLPLLPCFEWQKWARRGYDEGEVCQMTFRPRNGEEGAVKMLTPLRFACDSRLGRYQNLSRHDAVDFPLHMLALSGEYFE